jgi:hypothetical protein
MSKYRFKTEEEFKADGQWDKINHCPIGWNSDGEMNHYLGQDVPEEYNESIEDGQYFYEDGKYFYIDGWTFESTNCILKENVSFKKGKWYKGEANNYYIKFDRIEKDDGFNNIYYTERIYSKEYKKISDCWANNDFESYALHNPVDLSEIQEFLPDNHEDKIVKEEEDYTGMYIKALVPSPNCTGVYKGDSIKIISKKNETQYVLDKTKLGIPGMKIRCPLERDLWELVEENSNTLDSFPSSGAILISECDNLKEFKRYLFDSGRTCNEAVGNPKYLAWNDSSFWYPTTSTSKTMYQWNELKHFIPTELVKSVPYSNIQKMEKEWFPEIGEWVVITNNSARELGYPTVGNNSPYNADTIAQVDSRKYKEEQYQGLKNSYWVYLTNINGTTNPTDTNAVSSVILRKALPHEIPNQISEKESKDPLYICKQKYRKGMRVRSACKTGIFSGEFIIDVDFKEFRNLPGDKDIVDYSFSPGYLYYNGEYAEILEEGVYDISEIIKTKPLIEPVQSVDVKLRTKKQINKHLKF